MHQFAARFFAWFFAVVWIAFMIYWRLAALRVKTTERLEPLTSRLLRSLAFLAAIALFSLHRLPVPWLNAHFLPAGRAAFFTGAVLTVAGLLFAVWARLHLGANWSRDVTIKRDHTLIVTGPYALVRHPIYTGLLTALLGTAIAIAEVRALVAVVLLFLAFWHKLRLEEQWMRSRFCAAYTAYARRTSALIPWLL
jgi:protein-S-isoprenylcysteine O-methyltransferase Ste14